MTETITKEKDELIEKVKQKQKEHDKITKVLLEYKSILGKIKDDKQTIVSEKEQIQKEIILLKQEKEDLKDEQ